MRTSELPPLVDPGPPLSPAEALRYARHVSLPGIGDSGQRRLIAARVLVVGAGGLGAPVLQYLAAAGVGTIGVIDPDTVEFSNLQRQVIHRTEDVGRSKVASAADAVRRINPDVRVIEHAELLTAANALQVIDGYHLVLDGTDNFPTRYLVNDACVIGHRPMVWGSILGFQGQVSVFWANHGPHYRDVHPVPPPAGSVPSCAENGVFGALCGVIGSLMAAEAIKLITGVGKPLVGRILFHDALDGDFRTIGVRADPDGAAVTTLVDYDAFCGVGPRPSSVEATELIRLLQAGSGVLLVDVREPVEHDDLAIPGSVLRPLADLGAAHAQGFFDTADEVVLYCRTGTRSAAGAAVLTELGVSGVRHLDGGILSWSAAAAAR